MSIDIKPGDRITVAAVVESEGHDDQHVIARIAGQPVQVPIPDSAPITYVWLAKKNQSGPPDVLGLFTSPERAKRVCQESANEYMGARSTPALIWQGDDTYCSADYHHPAAGMELFTIDMYELDKVQS